MYFRKSAKIFYEIQDNLSLATPYNNIGSLFLMAGNLDSAIIYNNKALDLYVKLDNKQGIANSYQNISHVYFEKEQFKIANKYLLKVLSIRNYIGNLQGKYNTLYDLSKVNSKLLNHEKALEYYMEYSSLRDSVLSGEMHSKVNELQEKYFSSEKDKQILILEKEAEIKQFYVFSLIGFVIALLFVTLTLIYFFRTKSKLLQQNKLFLVQQKNYQGYR